MANSMLSPAQRYAAAALLALALRHAQLQQEAQPLASSYSSSAAEDDDARAEPTAGLWTHQSRGLLRPVRGIANSKDSVFMQGLVYGQRSVRGHPKARSELRAMEHQNFLFDMEIRS
ncbi:hypothetical protein B296_00044981 [Ensete ventricosum]|uniref:Uncharacterized protein n=1 Tax=Ensete ventricosum TaxID=4639 RepID=A0A426YP26_ENSVE|nr:hypothetical protein B296_00044981 [Ensete ventricosum]